MSNLFTGGANGLLGHHKNFPMGNLFQKWPNSVRIRFVKQKNPDTNCITFYVFLFLPVCSFASYLYRHSSFLWKYWIQSELMRKMRNSIRNSKLTQLF